ncbi:DUF6236 family protein [Enterobacter sp. LM3]|uniref:DUF6236 family protein n=1 Tax=Enterobacter sp. LM3 TaxID=3384450 RepID=UPI003985F52C
MERGVVFSPCEVAKSNSDSFVTRNFISEIDINYFTLYWDKLVSPTTNQIHLGVPYESDLIDSGILTRPRFSYMSISGSELVGIQADIHAKTMSDLIHKSPDIEWRMHFLGEEINIPDSYSSEGDTLKFGLTKLLPVPQKDVHIADILEFKERRKPELLSLHEYLDELYFEVRESCDFNLSRAKAFSGLKNAIVDLEKLNNEGWKSPLRFDVSTSFKFNLSQIYSAGVTMLSASHSDNPFETLGVGTAVSVLGGFVSIGLKRQKTLIGSDPKLAYLTKALNEGIIKF